MLSASNTYAAAESVCPYWTDKSLPKFEHAGTYKEYNDISPNGPRLDANSFTWTRGEWFEFPLGFGGLFLLKYDNSGIRPKDFPNSRVDKQVYIKLLKLRFDKDFDSQGDYTDNKWKMEPWFAFWMPELRYLERNFQSKYEFRLCEAGRPKPSIENFLVRFKIEWPFIDGLLDSQVGNKWRIYLERAKTNHYSSKKNVPAYDVPQGGPIDGKKSYEFYEEHENLVVFMHCTAYVGYKEPLLPTCSGDVWDRSSNLVISILFPADQGYAGNEKKWIKPVKAAVKLAKKWHVK